MIDFLLHPLTLFGILILAGLLFRRKPGTVLFSIAFLWLFTISVSPLPHLAAMQLERQYFPLDPDSLHGLLDTQRVHIIVLGAGFTNDPDISPTAKLSTQVAGRLIEAIRLYRKIPGARIVTSGAAHGRSKSQAEAVAEAAIVLGVDPLDTLLLTETLTTEHEAECYFLRFDRSTPLIVCTDALHMPRAMFWFGRQGLNVIPAPATYYVKRDPLKKSFPFKPSLAKVDISARVIHEYVGILWAHWNTG